MRRSTETRRSLLVCLRAAALILALAAAGMACSASTSDPRTTHTTEPGRNRLGPTSETTPEKVLPPLQVGLEFDENRLRVGARVPLVMTFVPDVEVLVATGNVEASGVVELVGPAGFSWGALGPGDEQVEELVFEIHSAGEAEIKASVEVVAAEEEIRYGRSFTLYLLATEENVFVGTTGPLALQVERLDADLASGAITDQQYRELLEEVLGAGATESNVPVR